MKAGTLLAIVDTAAVARRGIAPQQPMLGDPNDSAPAFLPAPNLLSSDNKSEESHPSDGERIGTPCQVQDKADPDRQRRGKQHFLLNTALHTALLVGAIFVAGMLVTRLIDAFALVIGNFR